MEVLFSRSRYFSPRAQIYFSELFAVITFAKTRTWSSFVLQCLGICVTLLMLEQVKRGTPETSERAYKKRAGNSNQPFFFF